MKLKKYFKKIEIKSWGMIWGMKIGRKSKEMKLFWVRNVWKKNSFTTLKMESFQAREGPNKRAGNLCGGLIKIRRNKNGFQERGYCAVTDMRLKIDAALQEALELHNKKEFLECEKAYKKVMDLVGDNPMEETMEPFAYALLNLAQVSIMFGYSDRDEKRIDEATEYSKKLVYLIPLEPQGT